MNLMNGYRQGDFNLMSEEDEAISIKQEYEEAMRRGKVNV